MFPLEFSRGLVDLGGADLLSRSAEDFLAIVIHQRGFNMGSTPRPSACEASALLTSLSSRQLI